MKQRFRLSVTFFLVIIIAIELYLVFFQQKPLPSKTINITITDRGFIPKEATYTNGTIVTFINTDTQWHWPASDHHPLHELYPEFDPKAPLQPKDRWEFLFDRPGKWTYHDHLNPSLKGTINILNAKSKKQNLQNSKKYIVPKNELSDRIKQIVADKGAVEAWNFLKVEYAGNSYLGIHDIAHYLGSLIYKEKGLKGVLSCDDSFGFGCYHGFMEGLINLKGIDELNKVIQICQTIPNLQQEISCYHGIGHGSLEYYRYNFTQALKLCDSIIPKKYYRSCYSGVFMENAAVNYKKVTQTNPLWPCNIVANKYKEACYEYQMTPLAHLYNDDVAKISKACDGASTQIYITSCIKGLGDLIAQRNIDNPQSVITECQKIEGLNKYECQIAAAEVYIFEKKPFEYTKQQLCNTLPDNQLDTCLRRIEKQQSKL